MSTRLDTYDDVEFSRSLGVDFYRGRFLWKPVFQHDEIPANRLTIVRALSKLQEPDIPMEELEEIISQDLALSYKVQRWVNSANTGLKANVTSVSHAVRIAGVRRIKSWASAMLLSAIDDKPSELMRGSLIRARMSELLAATLNRKETDSYFTAGLFSALDALLDCPLEQAIKDLPLSPEIQLGLLAGGGPIGQTLDCTLAYERGDWDHVRAYGFDQGVALERIRDCYLDAIGWSEEILK
jgi:EAL and modified HD-GYP domain-containing signal transduction protein